MSQRSRDFFANVSDAGGSYKLIPNADKEEHSKPSAPHSTDGGRLGWRDPEEVDEDGPYYFRPEILDHPLAHAVTITAIAANAVIIGFETDYPDLAAWDFVENIFLALFTLELVWRLVVITPRRYFMYQGNPDLAWNLFDFMIVSSGIICLFFNLFAGAAHSWGKNALLFRIARVLRILRVLRIIRIVRFLKQLYLLVYGFMEGTMAVFWVTLLASFMLYICSVILVRTYGRLADVEDPTPGDEFLAQHFGSIPRTMFALFELISAPDLGPYRATMFDNPPLVVFLVTFIILGSFGINGLLVALINESILEKNQARIEAERVERESKRKEMQQRCRELFDELDVNKNRVLPRSILMNYTGRIARLFESLGVNFQRTDLDQMFYIMDYNDTGIIERSEFVQGVVELCDQIRPMSILELHCQVSKCSSKVERCESKVDNAVKSLEHFDVKLDALVEALSGLAASQPRALSSELAPTDGGAPTQEEVRAPRPEAQRCDDDVDDDDDAPPSAMAAATMDAEASAPAASSLASSLGGASAGGEGSPTGSAKLLHDSYLRWQGSRRASRASTATLSLLLRQESTAAPRPRGGLRRETSGLCLGAGVAEAAPPTPSAAAGPPWGDAGAGRLAGLLRDHLELLARVQAQASDLAAAMARPSGGDPWASAVAVATDKATPTQGCAAPPAAWDLASSPTASPAASPPAAEAPEAATTAPEAAECETAPPPPDDAAVIHGSPRTPPEVAEVAHRHGRRHRTAAATAGAWADADAATPLIAAAGRFGGAVHEPAPGAAPPERPPSERLRRDDVGGVV